MGTLLQPVERLGAQLAALAGATGEAVRTFAFNLLVISTLRFKIRATLVQMLQIGVLSLPIVAIACFATGMVMAAHVSEALAQFGADLKLAEIVLVSLLRELAPIFTALLIAGRAGSGMAAEIGSMRISEQLEAMRALSLSVHREILAPRVVATVLSVVCLTLVGGVAGAAGGYVVGIHQNHMMFETYHAATMRAFDWDDLTCGLFKAVLFGIIIAAVGCHMGLGTRLGAVDLGRKTKSAVVVASFLILVSDFFFTRAYVYLFQG